MFASPVVVDFIVGLSLADALAIAYAVLALAIVLGISVFAALFILSDLVVQKLDALYRRRFTARGFRFKTYDYAKWLAFCLIPLWLAIVLKAWLVAFMLAVPALTLTIVLSALGWRTRGERGTWPKFVKIFYEPAGYLASFLIVAGRVKDVAWPNLLDPSKIAFLW
jgi:hypothetical protein